METLRRPCCEHFLDYFPFTELQCTLPLSVFAHNILGFAHFPKKKKKKDTIPTKPLTWQMRMKVPLIFMFDCRNMADICARFKENPPGIFQMSHQEKQPRQTDIRAAWKAAASWMRTTPARRHIFFFKKKFLAHCSSQRAKVALVMRPAGPLEVLASETSRFLKEPDRTLRI